MQWRECVHYRVSREVGTRCMAPPTPRPCPRRGVRSQDEVSITPLVSSARRGFESPRGYGLLPWMVSLHLGTPSSLERITHAEPGGDEPSSALKDDTPRAHQMQPTTCAPSMNAPAHSESSHHTTPASVPCRSMPTTRARIARHAPRQDHAAAWPHLEGSIS
jgi:hypothetical protein